MAYIATYISTTSTTELGAWLENYSNDYDATTELEPAHKLAYDYVNEELATMMSVPVPKQATGRYPEAIKTAMAFSVVAFLRQLKLGLAHETTIASFKAADEKIERVKKLYVHFDSQKSADEAGIGLAIPNSGNTSTGIIETDQSIDFTGDVSEVYLITITTGGAIGTAVYKWKDGEGNETTGVTSHFDFDSLEKGLEIRFGKAASDTFVLNDTWTITCNPESIAITPSGGSFSQVEAYG